MAPESTLTTTSYAILGLLAIRPWTTYELAQQMDKALGQFWPRTRSKLYEEPKKLVALGLARATDEATGKRPRTVYAITPKGRRALQAWMKTPTGPKPALEFETLVRVFFAEHATKGDLLATIAALDGWAVESATLGAQLSRGYLDGEGSFPERLPWLILVGQFLDRFETVVMEWAAWARAEIENWPDDVRQAAPNLAALEAMARRNEAIVARGAAEPADRGGGQQ